MYPGRNLSLMVHIINSMVNGQGQWTCGYNHSEKGGSKAFDGLACHAVVAAPSAHGPSPSSHLYGPVVGPEIFIDGFTLKARSILETNSNAMPIVKMTLFNQIDPSDPQIIDSKLVYNSAIQLYVDAAFYRGSYK